MQHRTAAPYFVVAVGIVIACALMGLCVLQLFQSRHDALERASETSRNLGLMAERDIERNLELYDLSLQALIHGLQRPDVMAAAPALRREALFDHAMTAQFIGSQLVLDADGNIILDSANDVPRKGNFADRRYFTIHRDNPNVGLYVSDPFVSRLRAGMLSIALSRRISNPDGSFAGIALIAINLEYFHKLFAGLSLGQHGSISLIGKDGIMVMRQPYDVRTIGRDIGKAATFQRFRSAPEGSFSETASIDGVRRLYYFKNLPTLPLIIMVAEAEQDIYAAWRRRAETIGLLVATFGAAFIALSVFLGVQLRRRMRAESELELLARTDGSPVLTIAAVLGKFWTGSGAVRDEPIPFFHCCLSMSIVSKPTTTPMVTRRGTMRWLQSRAASAKTFADRPIRRLATAERNSSCCSLTRHRRGQPRLLNEYARRSTNWRSSTPEANTGV